MIFSHALHTLQADGRAGGIGFSRRGNGYRCFFLLGMLVFLQGCAEKAVEVAEVEKPRPVKVFTVVAPSTERNLTFPAVIEAAKSAELTFQIPGAVNQLNALESKEVKKGYLIAQLDSRNAANQLAQAKAQFAKSEEDYQRALRLAESDAISKSVLNARKTQRDVEAAALKSQRKALADNRLYAPFSGTIARVYVKQYQNVQAKEPIVLLQSDEVEAVINVPSSIVTRMPQLQPQGTHVILQAAPGLKLPAKFKEIAGEADANTQTYRVKFTFQKPKNLFVLPGMTATVGTEFLLNKMKELKDTVASVPLSAVLVEGNQQFVWVIGDDMRISKRAITVVPNAGNSVLVQQGLKAGEQVVAAGVAFLQPNTLVKQWEGDHKANEPVNERANKRVSENQQDQSNNGDATRPSPPLNTPEAQPATQG